MLHYSVNENAMNLPTMFNFLSIVDGGPEEVVNVDIEGYRLMSNASFKANFRMDRVVFQVMNCSYLIVSCIYFL